MAQHGNAFVIYALTLLSFMAPTQFQKAPLDKKLKIHLDVQKFSKSSFL